MPGKKTAEPVLNVKNLNVDFKVKGEIVSILKDVSFSLPPGKTLGVVGESGSGKSVTALSILKLIKNPPLHRMTGEIIYQGRDILPLDNRGMQNIRGRHFGFVFQEPMTALNPVLNIGNQILEMIRTHEKSGKKEAADRAVSLLSEVGIPNAASRMNSYPHEFSGGMRQRAMIAMALSCNPRILVADEPTTALDVTVQAQILELFRRLQSDRKMAILFISHDLRVIAEIADQVAVMQKGRVVELANVDSLFHSPGHPYTRQLLDLIPGRGEHGR